MGEAGAGRTVTEAQAYQAVGWPTVGSRGWLILPLSGSDRTDWIAYDCSNCVGVGVSLPEAFTEKCPLCEVGTLRPK